MPKSPLSDKLITKSVREAIADFLMDRKLEGRSPQTIRFYRDFLKPFSSWIGGDTPVSTVTPSLVRRYFAELQDGHAFAHHSRFRALRAFMRWCVAQGYLASNPINFRAPKVPDVIIPTFTDDEIKALIKSCTGKLGIRDKAMIMLFADTGIRLREMASLTLADINLEGRLIKVRGKGNKERVLHCSQATIKAIWQYMRDWHKKDEKALWLSEEGKPILPDGISQIIRRATERVGINRPHVGPHTFRHTFAANFLSSGGQELELQYLLGHTSLAMVEKYSRTSKAHRALKAHERFSPIDRLGLR